MQDVPIGVIMALSKGVTMVWCETYSKKGFYTWYPKHHQTSRKRDQKDMQEDGKGCCEMLSSRHDVAIARVNSQQLWLPS